MPWYGAVSVWSRRPTGSRSWLGGPLLVRGEAASAVKMKEGDLSAQQTVSSRSSVVSQEMSMCEVSKSKEKTHATLPEHDLRVAAWSRAVNRTTHCVLLSVSECSVRKRPQEARGRRDMSSRRQASPCEAVGGGRPPRGQKVPRATAPWLQCLTDFGGMPPLTRGQQVDKLKGPTSMHERQLQSSRGPRGIGRGPREFRGGRRAENRNGRNAETRTRALETP